MSSARRNLTHREWRPRAAAASEWGRTLLTQSLIGILLALLWAMLGLQ